MSLIRALCCILKEVNLRIIHIYVLSISYDTHFILFYFIVKCVVINAQPTVLQEKLQLLLVVIS